jgi:hypothetical protein
MARKGKVKAVMPRIVLVFLAFLSVVVVPVADSFCQECSVPSSGPGENHLCSACLTPSACGPPDDFQVLFDVDFVRAVSSPFILFDFPRSIDRPPESVLSLT